MKKLFFTILIIFCALFAVSCDLSSEVNELSKGLYDGIRDLADPYLSEAGNSKPKPSSSSSAISTEREEDPAAVGTEVGNKLPGALLQVFDENGFTGQSIDPSKQGRVTVINFWGTWCHFCLEELPHFSTLASEYSDSVTFIAIHTDDYFNSETNGAVDYVKNNFADSKIIFAKDTHLSEGGYDDCYTIYGGSGSYPYTIIIDENGIVTFKAERYLDESALKAELDKALNQ